MLKITNEFGNFDLVHRKLPKGYAFVAGSRLQPMCRKHKIKFVPAITDWKRHGKYPSRPVIGGVIVRKAMVEKLQLLIAASSTPEALVKKNQARAKRENKKAQFCANLGLHDYHQPLARAVRRGDVDEDIAELFAFRAKYRHEFTDYDQQYEIEDWQTLKNQLGYEEAKEYRRSMAHTNKTEDPIPANWPEYLDKYAFTSPIAQAMSKILKDPRKAHPTWFKLAEIAVRQAGLPLDDLNYEKIAAAIKVSSL